MSKTTKVSETLDFDALLAVLAHTPGLTSDKLKVLLELVWETIRPLGKRGLIFAYDEAQNLGDNSPNDEYPLSLLLDVFQSIQRKGIPFMLVLVGLPTLFPKLVETRTYTERMFHVVHLGRLDEESSREAIVKPIEDANSRPPVARCAPWSCVNSTEIFLLEGGLRQQIGRTCSVIAGLDNHLPNLPSTHC